MVNNNLPIQEPHELQTTNLQILQILSNLTPWSEPDLKLTLILSQA